VAERSSTNPAPTGPSRRTVDLALALDVDDLVVATRLADQLRPWFSMAKVGLELYSATGPDAVVALLEGGYRVFLDLKLYDIPTTVGRAARVLGTLGATYLTVSAAAGPVALRAAVEGLGEGASNAGLRRPAVLAVTILTSESDAPRSLLRQRVQAAVEAGCGGIVCAAGDVTEAKRMAPRLLAAVPGIRLADGDVHDQARASTPAGAVAAGADILVVGRAVTAAADPAEAAARILADLA
jgi:orotidine-5'-phosphate decarboxylase